MKNRIMGFLTNSHLNTIAPIYLTQNIEPNYVRERFDTPDGDFIDMDWVNKNETTKPTLILFHGIEGSSRSHYAKRIMYYIEQLGWRGVVPHFRGCSGELNRTTKLYHAGYTEDLSWMIDIVNNRTSNKLYASGVSLGGNALLKYLGENVNNHPIDAAFAISVPFNLEVCAEHLDKGFNKYVYVKNFLSTLLPKMKQLAEQFDNFNYIDHKIETMDEFNNTYICQMFGFKDALEYYEKAGCIPYLKNINMSTMILQAENDPMIPASAWPTPAQLSPTTRFVSTKTGGHAGFIALTTNYRDAMLRLPKFMVEYFNQLGTNQTVQVEAAHLETTSFFGAQS